MEESMHGTAIRARSIRSLSPGHAILLTIATVAVVMGCDASVAPPPSEEALAAAAAGEIRGFVLSHWANQIPRDDPGECPDGLNLTEREYYDSPKYASLRAELKKREEAGDREGVTSLIPPDACKDPTVGPDPGHIELTGNAAIVGIDLDGQHSEKAGGEQCAHDDFISPDGTRGIDNQYWRLMGCVKGYRPDGLFDRLSSTGRSTTENAHSQLLELTLIEGTRDNGKVRVQIFTGAGPVATDANGSIVRDTSQLVHEDAMYHSEPFEGEIRNGLLTAGPVDVKLRFKVQAIDNHYDLRDTHIRAEMLPDGSMKGQLAGFWPTDALWDFLTEVYIGPIHLGRAAAINIGYMCSGVYNALPRLADGHFDTERGQCTSLSTIIDFEAVPAFVIQPQEVASNEH